MKTLLSSLIIVFVLLLPTKMWATTYTWTGLAAPNTWNNAGNWAPAGIPSTVADDAIFPINTTITTAPVTINIRSIQVNAGISVNFSVAMPGTAVTLNTGTSSVGVGGQIACAQYNSVVINNGTFALDGSLFFNGNPGGLILNGTAALTVQGGASIGTIWDGTITLNGTSTLSINNMGVVSPGGSGNAGHINIALGATLNIAAGGVLTTNAMSIGTDITVNGTLQNAGTCTLNSGVLNINSGGLFNISPVGILSNAGGTVNVNAGGILDLNSSASYTGTSPVYVATGTLRYSGTGTNAGAELPTTMNGQVVINCAPGTGLNIAPCVQVFQGAVNVLAGYLNTRTNTGGGNVTTFIAPCTVSNGASILAGVGAVNGGAMVTVNGGGSIVVLPQATSSWLGNPTYAGGAAPRGQLVYINISPSLGCNTGQELPGTMNGDVSIRYQFNGDLTLSANTVINGSFDMQGAAASQTFNLGANHILTLAGTVANGCTNTIGNGGPSILNIPGAPVTSQLIIQGNAATINAGASISTAGILEIANTGAGTASIIGGGAVTYNPGSILQYSGPNNNNPTITEYPFAGPTNLILNKAGGGVVTLPGSRSLPATGQLNLMSGVLDMGATFTMTLNNTSPNPLSGALLGAPFSATKMVIGTLARAVNTGALSAFVFPMGAGANFIGAQVDVPAGINGIVTVKGNGTNSMGVADGTTIFTGTMSTTEYWEITSSVPITGARIDVQRPGGFAIGAELGESTMSNGTYVAVSSPLASASPNLLTPLSINLGPATKYYTAGAIATTYYYHAPLGVPTNATSWTSIPGGMGTAAPGFNNGYTFVIPSGQTATYTLVANYTVPAGVTIQVNNGGTLEIDGDSYFNLGTGTVTYMGATATLSYINGAASGGTGLEFPNVMPGRLLINRTPGTIFNLNQGKTVSGSATFTGGDVWTNGFNHTFNGAFTVNGGKYTTIGGGVTTIAGAATMTSGRIFLAAIANPLVVNGSLTISGGTLELNGVVSPQIDPASTGAVTFTGGVLQFSSSWSGGVNTKTLPIAMPADVEILSGTPQIGVSTTLSGNLTITTGSLTVNGGSNLTLAGAGAITTTGVANRINATTVNATLTIQRPNIDANWFTSNGAYNLTINANSTLTNPLSVANILTLSNGILTTSNPTNTLTIVNAAIPGAVVGGSPTTFIDGSLQRYLPVAYSGGATWDFPVGKGGQYAPFSLVAPVTSGGANPLIDVEAYLGSPGGSSGVGLGNLSPTEYWRIDAKNNNLVDSRYALGRIPPIAAGSQIAQVSPGPGGVYSPLIPTVPSTIAPGTPNIITSNPPSSIGLAVGSTMHLSIAGSAPTIFYYVSGNADLATSWNSQIGGGGSSPANFTTSGFIFYVPSGVNAQFANSTNFGSGTTLQVESGGTLTIPNGITVNSNGLFRINGGGRLRLQGTGNATSPSGIQYLAPTATLEYNAPVNRLTTIAEFPHVMSAQVEIHNGSVRMDASKHLQSSFLLNNSTLAFGAADRLRLSGSVTFLGATTNFATDSTDTLFIDGNSTLAGAINIPQLAQLTMNRGGWSLNLSGTIQITQQLGLFGGNVSVGNGASVILQSSADTALVGGNSLSFVSGSLVRQLRSNLTPTTTLPIFYPIGRGINYLPLTLTEATTGTVAPQVGAEVFATGAGGTPVLGVPGALSTSEYWRLTPVSGSFTGARVGVMRGGITAMNLLASSQTQTGLYTGVGGTLSNLPQGLSLLSDGVTNITPRFYAIVGTIQGSPRITGFTPSIGGEGTTMLITGINLTGVNAVAIGGIAVSGFTVLSSTTISVVVGAVATGPVQVGSPLGGAASDSSFTFVPAPVIGGIFPNPAGVGAVITISGTNLGGLNGLNIGGVNIPQGSITSNADGSFTTQIPLTATTSTIILSTPGGTVISTSALTFVAAPVLTSFSPAVSSTGAVITIVGQNFTPGTMVRFGDVFAQAVTVNNSGRLSVVVPAQVPSLIASANDKSGGSLTSVVATSVFLTVRTGGGTVTSATQFVYSPFPNGGSGNGVDPLRLVVVSEARDKVVPVGGQVRVTGANLELIQELTLRTSISSTKASYLISSSAAMTVLIPSTGLLRGTNASLSQALVTVDALGAFNRTVVANLFTVVGVPTITSVAPTDVAVGDEVLVSGENLDLITGAAIGSTNASFRLVNGQLFVRVPTVPISGVPLPAAGVLQFTSIGGISTTGAIINAALASGQPVVLSFSPANGGPGTTVQVSGVNFTHVTDALVGGVPVGSFVINSSTQMTITLSAQVTASSQGGITLLSPFGSTVSLQPFVFSSSLAGDTEALERALQLAGLTIKDIGIEQTDNRITSVRIGGRALNISAEPFVSALVPLTELRNLDVSNSGLTGAIPQGLARFTKLESLIMSGNSLTGSIPSDVFCSYKNLQILDVSRNKLEGLIPVCIATLDKVQTLNLSHNQFTGGLPKELGGMVSLKELLVNNNKLTGGLPPEFGTPGGAVGTKLVARTQTAQTLRVVDVSANELTGTIPTEWGGMSALEQINVSNNRLSGTLPASIIGWESLTTMRLANNRFTGIMPALTAKSLTTIAMENNSFEGRLPEELGTSGLRVLTAEGNSLTGLPKLPRINTLRLGGNKLEFGSLEPNTSAKIFDYVPQDSIGNGGDTVVRVSSRLVIPSNIGGSKTVYQWLRNGRVLEGAMSATLVLESARAFQSGVYVCRATNKDLPQLTLFTRSYRLVVTGADQTLDAPELLFPSPQAENIAVRPRLKWSSVEGAEQYELTIGRDATLRDVLFRRTVGALAQSSEQSYRLEVTDPALERGVQHFWRVRALAVGSEGIPSETRSFRIVPLGVDVGFSTIDAGRALIGTQRKGDGVLVNVGTSAVTLDSATAITNTEVFSLANQTRNVMMSPNAEVPINVIFTPVAAGEALASVQVWYKDAQQTSRQVRFDNALKGRGGALRVDEVNFEAARPQRTTLQSLRVINLSKDTVKLSAVRLLPTNSSEQSRNDATAFSIDNIAALGVILNPKDTLFVTVRCKAPQEADLRAQVQVEWLAGGVKDSAMALVKATVRAVNPDNPSVSVGVKARQDNLAPGSLVQLDVYILEGDRTALRNAAQPEIRAQVSFDPQVLALVSGARQLRTSSSTQAVVEVQTRWEGTSNLLATIDCRVVAGERIKTELLLTGLQWGKPIEEREEWERAVIVEEPLSTDKDTLTANVSRAGGMRLIGAAQPKILAVQPNPAREDVEIRYTVQEPGIIILTLVTAAGEEVQRLWSGRQEAGEYQMKTSLRGTASGSYRVVLTTGNGQVSQSVNVVK